MKISSINASLYASKRIPSCKGGLSKKTNLMIRDIQEQFSSLDLKTLDNTTQNLIIEKTKQLSDIYDNLHTIMERFGTSCKLDFEQLNGTQKHRFFIGSIYSYYKHVVGDAELLKMGLPKDVEQLGNIADKLAEINPYEVNTKFIIQKIPGGKVEDFKPDADYMFLEDRLIKS